MRIIAGKYRHRPLTFISDEQTRPTKDRIREAIFSAINNEIAGKSVLDLFAGSGSMGLEALSRDAKFATFNDARLECIKVIESNIRQLEITNAEVSKGDYHNVLKKGQGYDIIFIDPPYALESTSIITEIISEYKILNNGGMIVVETEKPIELPKNDALSMRRYKYGRTDVYIIRS